MSDEIRIFGNVHPEIAEICRQEDVIFEEKRLALEKVILDARVVEDLICKLVDKPDFVESDLNDVPWIVQYRVKERRQKIIDDAKREAQRLADEREEELAQERERELKREKQRASARKTAFVKKYNKVHDHEIAALVVEASNQVERNIRRIIKDMPTKLLLCIDTDNIDFSTSKFFELSVAVVRKNLLIKFYKDNCPSTCVDYYSESGCSIHGRVYNHSESHAHREYYSHLKILGGAIDDLHVVERIMMLDYRNTLNDKAEKELALERKRERAHERRFERSREESLNGTMDNIFHSNQYGTL